METASTAETATAETTSTADTASTLEKMRVADLIRTLEAELFDIGQLSERVQATLSTVVAHAAQNPEFQRNAQGLDLLTQRLYCLSGFLTVLIPAIPRAWRVNAEDAARSITLGALAERLSGVMAVNETAEFGALELF